jgi:hypothetical protein
MFGKYYGKTYEFVLRNDKQWLLWAINSANNKTINYLRDIIKLNINDDYPYFQTENVQAMIKTMDRIRNILELQNKIKLNK